MSNLSQTGGFNPLPGPFRPVPSPEGPQSSPIIRHLVRSQVQALLEASPAFHGMDAAQQQVMADNMVKIAAYSAALTHDEWAQSLRLGQTPLLHQQTVLTPLLGAEPPAAKPIARAAAAAAEPPPPDTFSPRAASQVARVTRDTLNAIAFPTFVADLIKGTYSAIVDASIKQMEAYAKLLENVAMTVDQFMANNISDNQSRDYLAAMYPEHMAVDVQENQATLRVRDNSDEREKPNFQQQFGLNSDIDLNDETVEQVLVPAARRQMAQMRQQVLATMVMMGINRIVVTSGRIKAAMNFHIDTRDTATAKSASQFDMKNEARVGTGGGLVSWFGGFNAEMKNSIAYVSTQSREATDEVNVQANMSSEVEIKFKSDYFPMERLATPAMLSAIQGNTPNPTANAPAATGRPQPVAGAQPPVGAQPARA